MNLGEVAPTIDALLAMEADELGLRLLPLLERGRRQGGALSLRGIVEGNFPNAFTITIGPQSTGPYPGREIEARAALVEAWAWLEGQGLIVPVLRNDTKAAHPEARTLSRRAIRLAAEPRLARTARLLPKETLHPTIREDIWALYHRGQYDMAVFGAMKAVEVSVRDAAGLPAELVGVKLMRKAFAPENGPLSDRMAESGERIARMEMFAGAIGSYKNPQSHRRVDLDDANEAAEIIMLANHLLRIVDVRGWAILIS